MSLKLGLGLHASETMVLLLILFDIVFIAKNLNAINIYKRINTKKSRLFWKFFDPLLPLCPSPYAPV